jgi:hypothetical protein
MHDELYTVKVRNSSWGGGLSERSGKGSFFDFYFSKNLKGDPR